MRSLKANRKIVYLAGFLFFIPLALISYVTSSFLASFTGQNYVGTVFAAGSLITVLALFTMPKILNHIGNRKTALFASITFLASLFLMALSKSLVPAVIGFSLSFLAANFIMASIDVFIEELSGGGSIGKQRGLYLAVIGISWVLAQLLSGSIISKSSFSGVYLFSGIFMMLVVFIFSAFLRDFKDPHYKEISAFKTLKEFIGNKNWYRVYLINLIFRFFSAWMIIYIPIYLIQYIGFEWDKVGPLFGLMLLPFVLLSFPLGKLSDRMGEKEILIAGLCVMGLSTLAIPFIQTPNFLVWAIVLFSTRVGASTIEVMSESYFYKSIHKEDAEAISFFKNTYALSFIIGPALATPLLLVLPSFKFLFFVLGAIILSGLLLAFRLKDVT